MEQSSETKLKSPVEIFTACYEEASKHVSFFKFGRRTLVYSIAIINAMEKYAAQQVAAALAQAEFQSQREQLLIDSMAESEQGYITPVDHAGKDWEQFCG